MSQADPGERGAEVRLPPPAIFVAFLLLGWGLSYAASLPVPGPRYVSLPAGVTFIVAGFWLIADARKLFARTGQEPAPWKPSPELVLSGAYRFTRNPMYLGLTCIQAGLGLAVSNLWITVLAPVSLLVVHFLAVLPEEKYLTEKFGESYRSYLTKVRRYL